MTALRTATLSLRTSVSRLLLGVVTANSIRYAVDIEILGASDRGLVVELWLRLWHKMAVDATIILSKLVDLFTEMSAVIMHRVKVSVRNTVVVCCVEVLLIVQTALLKIGVLQALKCG